MQDFKLLDCTLRDGGYLNDWNFGHNTLTSVFERIVASGVEVIEVGFLDDRRPFDINRSIMPDSASAEKIYGKIDKGNAMIVGMIDFGTCAIENLQPCSESYLDGIRVIFKKEKMHDALAYCRAVKALGYQVFTQAVSITSYTDDELVSLINMVNEVQPYAVSMVDTYGLLHQDNLLHTLQVIDKHLAPSIGIGYHAHNNFQMGYANCIEMLRQNVNRMLMVDATLYGMGKSAGNAPLELVAMHMNETLGKSYDVSQMLEAIEINIMEIYKQVQWGYNLFYYVAAATACHPNYVSYLMNKHTLSIKSIHDILRSIEEPKKLLYDKQYIEQKYLDYQTYECDDAAALDQLREALGGKPILVLGPGKSIVTHEQDICHYRDTNGCTVVAINYIPECCKPDYLFLTNAKRYTQLSSQLTRDENRDIPTIATSNLTKTSGVFTYALNYSTLIDPQAVIQDNSLMMLLRAFMSIGVDRVALAGFDGYSSDEMNYFSTNMEYNFIKEKAAALNTYAKEFFAAHEDALHVTFVTPSKYKE